MPGLIGIISTNGKRVNQDLARAMRNAIRHQDWYIVDDYVNERGTVAISRVHLGIIGQGKQPFSARNDKIRVFLYGEIYNDGAANSNPLEFIYRLYEKEGSNFASFLNGSFTIVIVDEYKDTVLFANDRIATKPIFYFYDGKALYFGPEIKSLLGVSSLKKKLNLVAVADFLANGHFTADHTLIEGLETLDRATVLEVKNSTIARRQYWEFELEEGKPDRGAAYYREKLSGLLRLAVRRRLRTDNTYGILLSGGYDSRAILGCYLEARGNDGLHTISWGRAEDIPNGDCAIAKRLAHKLGADHHFYRLAAEEIIENFRDFVWLGEGLTWFPESYQVFHRIREQQSIDVVLRGDECFGYSHWLTAHDEHTMFRALDLRALRHMPEYREILKPHYYDLFCELDTETIRQRSAQCRAKNIHNRKDFFYLDARLQHYLNPLNSVKNLALESFTPWLDHDILDFVSDLPIHYRLGKEFYRETVVGMFPELYGEIAEIQDIIDWAASFKSSPSIERFVYRELVEKRNAFDEFINPASLKAELDAFFASPIEHSVPEKASTFLIKISPLAFHMAHKGLYYAKRLGGKVQNSLPPERLILHLLILKTWCDVFLNYPTTKSRD